MTENPYESPETEERPLPERRSSTLRIVGIVLLALGMFPAAGIACFVTCIATAESIPRTANDPYRGEALTRGMLYGGIAGVITFCAMALLLAFVVWRTVRRSIRKVD